MTQCIRQAAWEKRRRSRAATKQDARQKTAFITRTGLYEFQVVPFGLRNAPAFFQRSMQAALADVGNACICLDDILLFSSIFDEHIALLNKVLQRLRDVGLRLKREKISGRMLLATVVHYLSHGVACKEIGQEERPKPDVKEAVSTEEDEYVFEHPRKALDNNASAASSRCSQQQLQPRALGGSVWDQLLLSETLGDKGTSGGSTTTCHVATSAAGTGEKTSAVGGHPPDIAAGSVATSAEPATVKEALASPDSEEWRQAILDEFAAMQANDVYDVVPRADLPKGHKLLRSMVIFREEA
ncbi:hypothetical protein PTSG_09998 [Salpingoeca rosetta]|uniref:Reverse transcriptase domain-containing protein n=1 Tax=Salpingoeca rosetta (strain ATCC 50818 / BSB-021) TaxID=946362 RepID=F2UP75_SALR5|nr:uncharacterized protein PTSG_09998 [Salpingoeca rosetta]EGD79430.1 hypothetical protein PTSG_09998 [Salpingoeca rosetta]|eukprot:XP_004988911.1 hypothetical protein PTSG_09998 [Salpingoeca rosetta]